MFGCSWSPICINGFNSCLSSSNFMEYLAFVDTLDDFRILKNTHMSYTSDCLKLRACRVYHRHRGTVHCHRFETFWDRKCQQTTTFLWDLSPLAGVSLCRPHW